MIIRNLAIIAHVDHGKTTLVDAILKQSSLFRENQKEMSETLLLDSNDLEREKGITILAKNTAVMYKGEKINIIDTPGHADFGSEVERILNMASGALLLVDAAEGPLPQTRYVLKKALESHLKIILLINKIDKKDARPIEIKREVETLFLDLAHNEGVLDFVTLYGTGRDGKVFYDLPNKYTGDLKGDLTPLFETIKNVIPNSAENINKPFQMLISTLDYDSYVGRLCIGKVNRGQLSKGNRIALLKENKKIGEYSSTKLFTSIGLERKEVDSVSAGDIVALAGIPELTIGQTVVDPNCLEGLPAISIEDPTIKITIGPNTSPFAGKEGEYVTSRQIKERIEKEMETNVGLRLEESNKTNTYTICGRGELHLSVLIEMMRREGFEFEVSKPQVIYKSINGVQSEPYEELTIDVKSEYVGVITDEVGKRKGRLINMHPILGDSMRFIYHISSRNLIGIRSSLLTNTRGTVVINRYLLGYESLGSYMDVSRNGVLIASQSGTTLTYGLVNAQSRGKLFVGPGVDVYEGMVVGLCSGELDIEVNVCKGKKLTNNRSVGEGVKAILEPAVELSLEQYLDLTADDELLEVTPKNIRLRKKLLTLTQRKVASRK